MASDAESQQSLPLLQDEKHVNTPWQRTRSHRPQAWLFLQGFFSALLVMIAFKASLWAFTSCTGSATVDQVDTRFPSPTFAKGPTKTGAEAFLAATGLPPQLQDHFPLVPSSPQNSSFDIFKHFGNLSPQYSVDSAVFGLPGASSMIPDHCELGNVHLLHRHGARYPTTGDAPARFGLKVEAARKAGDFKATGKLAFLNDWNDPLGAEILTPFGRLQLFKLGINFRLQYGHLLEKAKRKLVFRTTTQDRMTNSALNFHAGFWGLPYQDKYHQLYLIEAANFNNTLCGDLNCPNAAGMRGYESAFQNLEFQRVHPPELLYTEVRLWINAAFDGTKDRLRADLHGMDLTNADVFAMMELCSYESVSLGYSAFCDIFTQQDFINYNYAFDLVFYSTSFGDPIGSALGIGWVEELVSRLTGKRLMTSHSSVNSSITKEPDLFPLDQPIYIDATHDTTITSVLAAMNFTNLIASGDLPYDHIPENRSFVTSNIVPFAAHLVAQVLDCTEFEERHQIRFILNDGVLPLSQLKGCDNNRDGLCSLPTFINAMQQRIQEVDFQQLCFS